MKIRIKFTKTGNLRFIGHLDVMRYFQKLMRRAKVDIRYSEGYSPHQIMSFAQPLGLGDTSTGEYVDIEVNSTDSSEAMLKALNDAGMEEIRCLSYVKIDDETRHSNAMSNVAAADYRIYFRKGLPDPEDLTAFFSQESIIVTHKTKTKTAETDIRPLIYEWRLNKDSLFIRLATGSSSNCKPDTVMEAFDSFRGREWDQFAYHYHRLEMYARKGEELVTLESLGNPIP